VKPLPEATTEEDLRKLFEKFGLISECKVMIDRATGLSRQIGFVRFQNHEDAARALEEMNSKQVDNGASLTVKFADTKEQKSMRKQRQKTSKSTLPPKTPSQPYLYAPNTSVHEYPVSPGVQPLVGPPSFYPYEYWSYPSFPLTPYPSPYPSLSSLSSPSYSSSSSSSTPSSSPASSPHSSPINSPGRVNSTISPINSPGRVNSTISPVASPSRVNATIAAGNSPGRSAVFPSARLSSPELQRRGEVRKILSVPEEKDASITYVAQQQQKEKTPQKPQKQQRKQKKQEKDFPRVDNIQLPQYFNPAEYYEQPTFSEPQYQPAPAFHPAMHPYYYQNAYHVGMYYSMNVNEDDTTYYYYYDINNPDTEDGYENNTSEGDM